MRLEGSSGVQPLLQQVAQDRVQLGFEHLQEWRVLNISGQPFAVFDHPFSKKKKKKKSYA